MQIWKPNTLFVGLLFTRPRKPAAAEMKRTSSAFAKAEKCLALALLRTLNVSASFIADQCH